MKAIMRVVAYIRVSSQGQVTGHSLEAQERAIREYCRARGWILVAIYREEGRSAHSDSITRRPKFRQLLDDAAEGSFDMVLIHTMDRWARNARVALDSMSTLGKNGVELKSVTEDLDRSTPIGKFSTTMMVGMAEMFSDMLGTHVKKGMSERVRKGLHLGAIPFGYDSCNGPPCDPQHPGGVHLNLIEAEAVREVFRRYASGTVTLSQFAQWVNDQGFRTRNRHRVQDEAGNWTQEPRYFTTASVKGILHNPFYAGKIKHGKELLPGAHQPLVSWDLFQAVQIAMKRNSGRSETLQPRPEREYLLKGLAKCVHCRLPMWAQTYKNGLRYYREQKGSRGMGYCVGKSRSMPCHVPDDQIGRIVGALVLPDAWMDRALVKILSADEVDKAQQVRHQTERRLVRLGKAYVDGLYSEDDYRREKRAMENRLGSLVVPEAGATEEAGKLLEALSALWEEATLSERRKLLLTMLDAVYVDTVDRKSIVSIQPKPAFQPLFEIAETREGSDIVLKKQDAPGSIVLWDV